MGGIRVLDRKNAKKKDKSSFNKVRKRTGNREAAVSSPPSFLSRSSHRGSQLCTTASPNTIYSHADLLGTHFPAGCLDKLLCTSAEKTFSTCRSRKAH